MIISMTKNANTDNVSKFLLIFVFPKLKFFHKIEHSNEIKLMNDDFCITYEGVLHFPSTRA